MDNKELMEMMERLSKEMTAGFTELRQEIAGVKADVAEFKAEVKADIAVLNDKLEGIEDRLEVIQLDLTETRDRTKDIYYALKTVDTHTFIKVRELNRRLIKVEKTIERWGK